MNNRFCRKCGAALATEASSAPEPEADAEATLEEEAELPDGLVDQTIEQLLVEAQDKRDTGLPRDAIPTARRAADRAPQDPRPYSLLGNLYETAGLYDEAVAKYERAVALDPDNRVDQYRLQALLTRMRKLPLEAAAGPAGAAARAATFPPMPGPELERQSLAVPVLAACIVFVLAISGGAAFLVLAPGGDTADGDAVKVAGLHNAGLAGDQIERGKTLLLEHENGKAAAGLFQLALKTDPTSEEAAYWLKEAQRQVRLTPSPPGLMGTGVAEGLPLPDGGTETRPGGGTEAPDVAVGVPPAVDPSVPGGQATSPIVSGQAEAQVGPSPSPQTPAVDPRGGVLPGAEQGTTQQYPWSRFGGQGLRRPAAPGGTGATRPTTPGTTGQNTTPPSARVVGESDPGAGGRVAATHLPGDLAAIVGGGGAAPAEAGSDRRGVVIIRPSPEGTVAPGGSRPAAEAADSALARQRRGSTLLHQGDTEGARRELNKAVELYEQQGNEAGKAGANACRAILSGLGQR